LSVGFRLLLLLLLPASARAASREIVPPVIDHETLTIVGWDKNCAVALSHLRYPVLGSAIADEPVKTELGVVRIAPGREHAAVAWRVDWEGKRSWKPGVYAQARADLTVEGFSNPGWPETVRTGTAEARDLPRLLTTTDTFKTRGEDFPDPARWRLASVYYSPLDAVCGLLVFEDTKAKPGKPFYQYRLVRINNHSIRTDRALAHDTNAMLLLANGDRVGALAETEIAAKMAPDYSTARYLYARMLSLNGKGERAIDELEAAAALDPLLKTKARHEPDFEDLHWMPRYQDLVKK
jgi:hypothetical protein